MNDRVSPRQLSGVIALAALAGGAARADPGVLAGVWSGGGSVTFGSGVRKGPSARELQPTLQVQLHGQRAMRDAVRQRVASGQRARWREQLSRQLL